jgi:hypothetical protein
VGYRRTTIKSLFEEVVYERAYYHCQDCQQGWFPTDEELSVRERQTPGARQVIALVGLLEPFAEGAEQVLPRLSGMSVSPATVQRTTEAVGKEVASRRARGETIGPASEWTWHTDALGQSVAYVSLDATGVLQQGLHAEKADGRMAWVAAVFNPQPAQEHRYRRVWQRRYVSGLMSLPEVGAQLRRECQAVGVARAGVVIGLTDGGAGLEDCLTGVLGGLARQMIFILDFYHASEHLLEFVKVLIPHDDQQRRETTDRWCHILKYQGGRVLLETLQNLDLSRTSSAVREAHRQLIGYLGNNVHRTDYPVYTARGWQIGSGMIEASCKTVVGHRLKASGMRWREQGTTALCQLRALYKSESALWQSYWKPTAAL